MPASLGLSRICRSAANVDRAPLSMKMLFDVLMVFDVVCVGVGAWLSYYFYLDRYLATEIDRAEYILAVAIAAVLFLAVGRQHGQYEVTAKFDVTRQIASLIFTCAATAALGFSLSFFLKVQADFSRVWVLVWVVFVLLFGTAGRLALSMYIEKSLQQGMMRRSVILIGAKTPLEAARRALERSGGDFAVAGTLDVGARSYDGEGAASLTDRVREFVAEARRGGVDEVVIALPAAMGTELEIVLRLVQALPADVRILPDLGGAQVPVRKVEQVGGLPMITTATKPISEWGRYLKRAEDLAIGLVGLLLFAPAMAAIALAIKLDTPGPVLFRQRRHGYNHKVIEVLKFRTMTVLEDGDTVRQATRGDKRVTRVGAFLRRTSLDELPQFINVVRGEMSLVGPRPHALAHNSYYEDLLENYSNRHRVKPGITGWAQVHGFRGETRDPAMMAERVRYDLEYIEDWSIWLDLKILIMTPVFGVFRRTAY